MTGEHSESLRWQDLSRDDVYHIAHIENESRDTAPAEAEEITRLWLGMQTEIRDSQLAQIEANRQESHPAATETVDSPLNLPQPIGIPQPEGSPIQAYLTVPSRFVNRYKSIETRLGRGRQAPSPQFIAAAVLYDEHQQIADSEMAKLARDLAAADEHIRDNPGTPILAISGVYLQAGTTAEDGGLYFRNYGSPGMAKAMVVVPCVSNLEADVDTRDPASVTLSKLSDGPARGLVDFLTPRHILSPHNVDKAPDASRHFLKEPMLLVGRGVAKTFFDSLLAKKRGSKGAEQRRIVAEQVISLLTGRSSDSP